MRSFQLALTVTLIFGMSAGTGAAPYRSWSPKQPIRPVHRPSYDRAQPVQQANCVSGCETGCSAQCACGDFGNGCAAGGELLGDPCCDCGPCGCPDLIGGLIRHIGLGIHWLLCCHHCGGHCGGTCCGGPCGDACCDSCDACAEPWGVHGVDEGSIDLVPTPTEPAPQQSNPFKDDTVSVVPRAVHRGTSRSSRPRAARRPAVIRSAYTEPIRQLPRPRTTHRRADSSTRVAAAPASHAGRPLRRLQPGPSTAPQPAAPKAAILESLKRAIQ